MKGNIVITLDGASFEDTERCRRIIHTMFEAGVFNVRNGKAILNFDNLGLLAEIELQVKRWKRDKPMEVLGRLEQFRVELTPVDKSSVAKRIEV